ncbi:hypothetical protein IscW_ISCW019642 [Ixodes scapularis]|uniref:UDP-D-xylose:beta-D-glucoside alpha-1,3-D-xylosyltransferase n=1 Tax=Ixodes scapularis TaxID=6945 RepID=B7PUF1_IXOSC|nr:hypothetical protein IscW_ISCW019642 [Ixodes scapularis]|eukprot:XP_002405973.1 hypothetical protein IscW_ISCW019642 [Ixodes scapularis]
MGQRSHRFVYYVPCLVALSVVGCLLVLFRERPYLASYRGRDSRGKVASPSAPTPEVTASPRREPVKLVMVTCGDHLNITLVSLKSAVAFSKAPLHLLLFASDASIQPLREQSVLPEEDAVLYVDADVIFVHPPEDLWSLFGAMNDSQLAALVPESEDYATNWYRRFARHPFFEPLGVNSGVMLMNLTRMRAFGWESLMGPLLTKYERNISWGDQDLINIVFHDHPDKLLVLSCKWNFRTDHCMYGPNCLGATAALLHGNRNVFQTSKEPAFRAVYLAMQQARAPSSWPACPIECFLSLPKTYQLGSSLLTGFLDPLEKGLRKARTTRCGQELLGHLAQWRERQLL